MPDARLLSALAASSLGDIMRICVWLRPKSGDGLEKTARSSPGRDVSMRFRIAEDIDELHRVFDIFVRQKLRRYSETLGMSDFSVPGQRAYYLGLARCLVDRNVQLAYLEVNGEVIATALNLMAGRRLYYLMCAYEGGSWAKYSPGTLLLEELICWAIRHGVEIFDLGIGDEPYKLKWRQEPLALWGAMMPRTMAGRTYCAAIRARRAIRRSLPDSLVHGAKTVGRTAGLWRAGEHSS